MTQDERLDFLIEAFKAESEEYKKICVPAERDGKRQFLRVLMNVRMPGPMSAEVLAVQDAYLRERAEEKGIVGLDEIPVICDGLSIWQGDITRLAVDAIVNAANSAMLGCFVPGHNCIDNCIQTYAGIQMRAECDRQMKLLKREYGQSYVQPTAIPLLTDGYNLPAKKVVHIVGPVVTEPLTQKHRTELAACYTNTLDLCMREGLKNLAFCCISTGVFHFPNEEAAEIAVNTVRGWQEMHGNAMERIIFNVFKDEDKKYYETLMR